jgi:SAM-dependent methyltransferase/uncharacterized protein YbaR (Trm112 family)
MYPEALDYLRCPREPTAPLVLSPRARYTKTGAIETGLLSCTSCGLHYPIRSGVADLLPGPDLPTTPTQLANALPLTAWAYERTWRPQALTLLSGEPFGYERELLLLTGLAGAERGGLIVDLACSNGLYARALERARHGTPGHVIGIDHAMPMLQQARAFAQAEQLRISFVRAKAQALPFADGAVTTSAMGGSLNEIGDSALALRELCRTLAPNGRSVLMSLVAGASPTGRAFQGLLGLGGVDFPPLDELNRRLTAAGLRLRAQLCYRVVVFSLVMRQVEKSAK